MAPQSIALVLAGGGARGAYEAGVLSVLLPALPEAERPNLILGASVGAINGAYLAATLPDGGDLALDRRPRDLGGDQLERRAWRRRRCATWSGSPARR